MRHLMLLPCKCTCVSIICIWSVCSSYASCLCIKCTWPSICGIPGTALFLNSVTWAYLSLVCLSRVSVHVHCIVSCVCEVIYRVCIFNVYGQIILAGFRFEVPGLLTYAIFRTCKFLRREGRINFFSAILIYR
jgi:hypothetical protein